MPIAVLEHAAVGTPITRAGVSLFPVYLHGGTVPRIVTGAAADLAISERPDAEVPTLTVVNRRPEPVLLVEGETVSGGRQNRTLNVSVLVPPQVELDLPVSCVEHGRWGGGTTFDRTTAFSPRRVRRAKQATVVANVRRDGAKRTDQGVVWDLVAHELDRLGVQDDAGSLLAAEGVLERDAHLADAVRDLVDRGPLPGQCGVVVGHGRRVVAAEVFAGPELLTAHWDALVRGVLLDAPERPTGTPSASAALRFLRRLARSKATVARGVGLGAEHHVRTSRLVGQALILDTDLVHASAFALAA